jgi:hypothetical protein
MDDELHKQVTTFEYILLNFDRFRSMDADDKVFERVVCGDFLPNPHLILKTHRHEFVYDMIKKYLDQHPGSVSRIVLAGHSLGGMRGTSVSTSVAALVCLLQDTSSIRLVYSLTSRSTTMRLTITHGILHPYGLEPLNHLLRRMCFTFSPKNQLFINSEKIPTICGIGTVSMSLKEEYGSRRVNRRGMKTRSVWVWI